MKRLFVATATFLLILLVFGTVNYMVDLYSPIDSPISYHMGNFVKSVEAKVTDTTIIPSQPEERPSPHDRIKVSDIQIYSDKIVIRIPDARISGFADSNSMDPIIDTESNAIQIVPKNKNEIYIGDIISYESSQSENRIIHRVVDIGEDEQGWFAITKGDNLNYEDPEKVRFKQIKRILLMIMY